MNSDSDLQKYAKYTYTCSLCGEEFTSSIHLLDEVCEICSLEIQDEETQND